MQDKRKWETNVAGNEKMSRLYQESSERGLAILKLNVLDRYCVDRQCACMIGGNMRLKN